MSFLYLAHIPFVLLFLLFALILLLTHLPGGRRL
jgi:hypothetical protein